MANAGRRAILSLVIRATVAASVRQDGFRLQHQDQCLAATWASPLPASGHAIIGTKAPDVFERLVAREPAVLEYLRAEIQSLAHHPDEYVLRADASLTQGTSALRRK